MPEFHFSDVTINGRNSSFKPGRQLWEKGKEVHTTSMDLTLVFMSESFGNFEQRLIFEFGAGIKIVRNVGVQVSPESKLMNTLHFKPVKETENELVWIENHSIVPFDGEPEISKYVGYLKRAFSIKPYQFLLKHHISVLTMILGWGLTIKARLR